MSHHSETEKATSMAPVHLHDV